MSAETADDGPFQVFQSLNLRKAFVSGGRQGPMNNLRHPSSDERADDMFTAVPFSTRHVHVKDATAFS